MKAILLFTAILFGWNGSAQSYIDLPLNNSKWINTFNTPFGQPGFWVPFQVQFCAMGQDTSINSINYVAVDTCGKGYKGALRNDNGKVFFVPKDSAREFLLYDFTVSGGDTLHQVYFEIGGGMPTVDDIYIPPGHVDSVLIDGLWRKRINIDGGWVEGIGNLQGLFWEYWYNVSGYAASLLCMSSNGNTVYPEAAFGACESSFETEESNEPNLSFQAYPNPTFKSLKIACNGQVDEVILTAVNGQKMKELTVQDQKDIYLDINDLPSGIYILIVRSKEQLLTKRIVKN